MQIADRALAADRAVIAMRRLGAQSIGEQLLGIAIAPAQEIDDVERAEFAEQLATAVGLRALTISPTPTMTGMRSSERGDIVIFSCFTFETLGTPPPFEAFASLRHLRGTATGKPSS